MTNIVKLSEWINDNSLTIINSIPQKGVNDYLCIRDHFQNGDVKYNEDFQKTFRRFYALNVAQFTDQFYENYFPKFDELRGQEITKENIYSLLLEWYNIINKRKLNTIQFSFLTKLLHTIDNDKIIYDKWVRILFDLKQVTSITNLQEKLDTYFGQYQQLQNSYNLILDSGELDNIIVEFEKRFPKAIEISKIKKLDFIFWTAGKIWSVSKK